MSPAKPARNRALIYVRKSLVRSGADLVSPERQRVRCIDEAARHNWTVQANDIYEDAEGHQSGRTDRRPDWQRLLRRVRHDDTVGAVIVESLSRASRSVRDFFEFLAELQSRGIALVSLKEQFDTSTAMGMAMVGLIAVINQFESDIASERMKDQIRFKKSGGRHWGLTPFGCDRVPVSGALVPSAETYALSGDPAGNGDGRSYYDGLVRCYELYAGGELGYQRLARTLNAEGWRFRSRPRRAQASAGGADSDVEPARPVRWTSHSVRSVLMMHRVYAGWVPVEGHNKDRPEEWVRGNYDPILPEELCERVGATLGDHSRPWRKVDRMTTPSFVHGYTLTGLLFCARCGGRLKGYRKDGRRHYRHQLRGDCPCAWSDADALEAQVIESLASLALPGELVEEVVGILLQGYGVGADEETAAELETVTAAIARTEAELSRLVDLAVQTGLNANAYAHAVQERNAELALLQERRGALERAAYGQQGELERIIARLRTLHLQVAQAPPAYQKELLRAVFERIEAEGDQIVTWVPREWCRPFF